MFLFFEGLVSVLRPSPIEHDGPVPSVHVKQGGVDNAPSNRHTHPQLAEAGKKMSSHFVF